MARSTGPSKETREQVMDRDGKRCLRCGQSSDPWQGWQIHHRRPRGAGSGSGDANSPSNLVLLDAQCHQWVETNRAQARADGYLVPQGTEPQTVPIRRHEGVWMYLWRDGTATEQPSVTDAFWAGWEASFQYHRKGGVGTAAGFAQRELAQLTPQPVEESLAEFVAARQSKTKGAAS
jgi:hypothetical protein